MNTCPRCKTPLDDDKIFCRECWNIKGTPSCLLCVIVLLGLLSCAVPFPPSGSMLRANMAAVSARGKDIYISITEQNNLRETSNLPPIWPKTCQGTTNMPGDISSRVFTTSTEYFEVLLNNASHETSNTVTHVPVIDASMFSGEGVPRCPPGQKLTSTNNMWMIAANITPEDSDIIPILITRNVDVKEIERVVNFGGDTRNLNEMIAVGKGAYKTPFGEKGFVLVRKGGGTFSNTAKYARLKYIFAGQTLPARDPSKPPIVYLLP